MAKLSNTSVYGNLGVANTISCLNLYVDRLGSAVTNGINIGDIDNTENLGYLSMVVSGCEINVNNQTNQEFVRFRNHSGSTYQYLTIGPHTDNGYMEIGTQSLTDAATLGNIYFNGTDSDVGTLFIGAKHNTLPAITFELDTNGSKIWPIYITEDTIKISAATSLILCGGTAGMTYSNPDGSPALTINGDGTVVIPNETTINSNIISCGSTMVGYGMDSPSFERLYFGGVSTYFQHDSSAEDATGAIQSSQSFSVFDPSSSVNPETLISADGYRGPQIGWQPMFFDDFNNDHISEYTYTGDVSSFSYNGTNGTAQITKATAHLPGSYTGCAVFLPLKKTINTDKIRYFTMRYRNRTGVSAEPFASGFVQWKYDGDVSWSDTHKMTFTLSTATTRQFYNLWLDLSESDYWTDGETVSDFRVHFDDPEDGAALTAAVIGIDYWGIGHRGFESNFTSTDMYFWSDVEIASGGTLSVSGDTSLETLSANTIVSGSTDLLDMFADIAHVHDFSGITNTAHTHDFSVITNTAHTHSEYFESTDVATFLQVKSTGDMFVNEGGGGVPARSRIFFHGGTSSTDQTFGYYAATNNFKMTDDLEVDGNINSLSQIQSGGTDIGTLFADASHNHDLSDITNTGHTHLPEEVYSGGTVLKSFQPWIQRSDSQCNVQETNKHWYMALTKDASSYVMTQFIVPSDYVAGTPITLDYIFEAAYNATASGYTDIVNTVTLKSPVLHPADPNVSTGRSYTNTYQTAYTTSNVAVYRQTIRRVNDLTITTDGTIDGITLIPDHHIITVFISHVSSASEAYPGNFYGWNFKCKYYGSTLAESI